MVALRPMFSSEGNDGDMVAITQTATAGNVLHTAVAGTNHIDEVYVYACNVHTAVVKLTLEIGGTTVGYRSTKNVPNDDGYHLVLPGIRVNNGTIIGAFAGTTAVVNCIVIVNRYIDPETAS
jgi:hypothetical protein